MAWENVNDGIELSVSEEIKDLIERHGREGYLRKKTNQRCRCIDPLTGDPEMDCPTCSSTGYVYLDHKIYLFRHVVTRPVSGAYRKDIAPFGILMPEEVVFYIQTAGINPSAHDWVVEVITGADGKVIDPPLIERCHDVNEVYDLRENHGVVAFWTLRTRKIELGK
jgi:hypothetical protein